MITEIEHKKTAILNSKEDLSNPSFINTCPVRSKTYQAIDGDNHE